jgi:2-dehydrotetronate isomerase
MPVFAANLSTLFTEWDFLDRFAAAADHGFEAVECQFPYQHKPDVLAARLERERLTLALFNAPPGDYEAGDRGLAALPERAGDFRASMAQAKIYAEHVGAKAVHVMAGIARSGDPAARAAYVEALRFAVERLDPVIVTVEPLNRRDAPGYYLDDFAFAADVIAEIDHPRLKLQFDVYHRQRMHGDVLTALSDFMPIIGHVQIASVPARAEPGTGELNDGLVFARIDTLGYRGYVGCEYRPARGTVAGLSWMRRGREGSLGLRSTWREKL